MAYTVCYYKVHLAHKDFSKNGQTIEKLNSINLIKYSKMRKYDNLEGCIKFIKGQKFDKLYDIFVISDEEKILDKETQQVRNVCYYSENKFYIDVHSTIKEAEYININIGKLGIENYELSNCLEY